MLPEPLEHTDLVETDSGPVAANWHQLPAILEAAIMAATQPLTIEVMSELFEESNRPTHNEIAMALETLSFACNERGIELVEVASGFRFQIKSAVYSYVARMWTERPARYSRALLETLALIAYRQPITRAEIEAVRGVAVSSQTIRTMEEREWIRVVGHREVPGRPALFGTTRGFLDYFKLKNLDELPTLSELKNLDTMTPEFDFDLAPNPPTAPSLKPLTFGDAVAIEPAAEILAVQTGESTAALEDTAETMLTEYAEAPEAIASNNVEEPDQAIPNHAIPNHAIPNQIDSASESTDASALPESHSPTTPLEAAVKPEEL